MPISLGVLPDEDILVTLVRGLGRARMIWDVVKVHDLASRFNNTPLKIFDSILNVLVREDNDLARHFYRKKMMSTSVQAFKLLQLIKSSPVKPNTVIYNTLIHALCKNGKVGRARSLMNEMEEPNDVTFNVLISAYCKCKEENLVQALALLEKSFTMGFVPDVITLTKVLKILSNVGRVAEAFEILERAESKGGVADVVAHNTLIKGYCRIAKENRLEEALEFLSKMQNIFPRAVYRSLRTLEFCEEGRVEDAKRVYDQMTGEGGIPSVLVYDCLIRGFCLKGCMREAVELMNEMVGCGCFPVASIFNAVICGFCTQGKLGSALKLMEDMVGRGCIPDRGSYSPLIDACCRMGDIQKAAILLLQMLQNSIIPDGLTWNSVLLCLSEEREWLKNKKMLHANSLLQWIIET
ncbi:hypothetical protein CRYUN_Cryun17cG0151500 [Craigia yunnanensis]